MADNFDINGLNIPTHIGFIMDGNGRWAKKRGLPRSFGHSAGAKAFKNIIYACDDFGIKYVTVYAFSTENWARPQDEVAALMKLFEEYLDDALANFRNENKVLRFVGDRTALSRTLCDKIEIAERETADKTGLVLNLAVNYGGRQEIVKAAKEIAKLCVDGKISPDDIDEKMISEHTYTACQPDPDLIVRPSGEVRISNFMIWQGAYAEYYFDNEVLWPDFNKNHLYKAITEYSKRNRRFGGVK